MWEVHLNCGARMDGIPSVTMRGQEEQRRDQTRAYHELLEYFEEGMEPVCPRCQHTLDGHNAQQFEFAFCPQCRFPLMLIAGKYKLSSMLAEGGFGAVYLATHTRLDRSPQRVIKVLKKEIFESQSAQKRFLREVQLTAELSQRNSHIVHIYDDFGEIPHFGHFYVMEYLQGQTLRDWLSAQSGPPPMSLCKHLFLQLCKAIHGAHKCEVLHRDLKPENIILIEKDRDPLFLKVLDFGIAKPLEHDAKKVTLTKNILGTPPYMSPEQSMGKKVDVRSDIYNMGLLLYELLTGEHALAPGEARQMMGLQEWVNAHISKSHTPLHSHLGEPAPHPLEEVVSRALAKRPRDRFASVEALESAFLAAVGGLEDPAPEVLESAASRPSLPTPQEAFYLTEELEDAPLTPPTDAQAPPAPSFPTPGEEAFTVEAGAEHKRWQAFLGIFGLLVGVAGLWWGLSHPSVVAPTAPPTRPGASRPKPRRQPAATKARSSNKAPAKASPKQAISPKQAASPKKGGQKQAISRKKAPQGKGIQARAARRSPSRPRLRRHRAPQRRRFLRRRRALRKAPSHRVRAVKGCPKTPYFWTFLRLSLTQLHSARPRLSGGGKLLRKRGGFCVGIKAAATITFGKATAYVPCTLQLMKLPPRARLSLQKEGISAIEPDSPSYCLKP